MLPGDSGAMDSSMPGARRGQMGHTSSPVFRRMPQDPHRGREQPARRGLPAFSHGAAAKLRCQAWAPVCSEGAAAKVMCWLGAAWSVGGSLRNLLSHCSRHSAIHPSGGSLANMVRVVRLPGPSFALLSARAVVG